MLNILKYALLGTAGVAMLIMDTASAQSTGSTNPNQFNPAISLILDGRYTNADNDADAYDRIRAGRTGPDIISHI